MASIARWGGAPGTARWWTRASAGPHTPSCEPRTAAEEYDLTDAQGTPAANGSPASSASSDMSFGVFGVIPLYVVWRRIKRLEELTAPFTTPPSAVTAG